MNPHQIQLFVDRSGLGVNWRLLAANNRETGRGTRLHVDETACRAEIRQLQAAADRFVPRARRAPRGRWSWELSLAGVVVLASTNSFDRLIRCEQVVSGLAERFGAASISPVLVDTAGRRRELNLKSPRIGEYV